MLQSYQLKQHMVTIGIDQLLSNCAMYEHRFPGKLKKLYTSASKFYDQLRFKAILRASMVSTTDIFTDNSPMSPGPPIIVKKVQCYKITPSIY